MPARPLFVYGTLRDADLRRLLLGAAATGLAVESAEAPDYRVVKFPARSYPALLAAPGATAAGALLRNLSTADMARLDLFEGPEYSRKPIEIIVSGVRLEADVYLAAIAIPPEAEDWRLSDWVARHKAAFLAAEAASRIGSPYSAGEPPAT